MRLGRAGILTKVIVLGLIIYMATALLNLRGQIEETEALRTQLLSQISTVSLENQQMSEAIANSDDPATLETVARARGYVKAGETLYIDIAG